MQRNKLQMQRLEKIKTDFRKHTYEEQKFQEQQEWLDHQSKNVIKARIKDNLSRSNEPLIPKYSTSYKEEHSFKNGGYDLDSGFEFHVDYVNKLERTGYKQ